MTIVRSAALILVLSSPAVAQVGPNVEELAKELANPGAANATLNFKLEYRTFDGTLPNARNQDSTTLTFQPVFPFVLQNGNNLIFRPSLVYVSGLPSPVATGFSSTDGLGDMPYDLLYSWSTPGGWSLGAGVVGSVPVDSGISSENWLLGPSFLATKPTDWGIFGFFPFHNEKIGGSGVDTSITSLQYFLFYSLGNGWLIGTGPTMSYNWNAAAGQEWTVPVQLSVSKTTAIKNRIVKLNFSIEKNVIAPDAFSEDWTYSFTFSPVIANPLQPNPPKPPVTRNEYAALIEPIKY